jgi:arabinofuranosyltransferase
VNARSDRFIAFFLEALTAIYAAPYLSSALPVMEDAAMLFRYSGHLAEGHGIVWNVGEPPLDGATDMLFMLLIAMCRRFGADIELTARIIGVAAHVATVWLVYRTIRQRRGLQWMAIASAGYVAIGPAKAYIAAAFGTTLFAALAALAWSLALRLADAPSRRAGAWLGLSIIILGIARPEGVLLGGLMAIGVAVYRRGDGLSGAVSSFLATSLPIGLAYFVWRWWYFGAPLPNPYYKKGGFHIYWFNVLVTAKYTTLLLGPMLLVPLFAWKNGRPSRKLILAAIPIVGFASLWILLSNEMNFFRRFQYAVVPMAAMVWPECIEPGWFAAFTAWWQRAGVTNKRAAIGASASALTLVGLYQHIAYRPGNWQDSHHDLGTSLRPFRDRGYVVATTEAGLIPFDSDWRAIDTWGLNDRWIAHQGRLDAEYLDHYHPHLIVFHAYFAPGGKPKSVGEWDRMTLTLERYAQDRHYQLIGAFGQHDSAMHYYLRPDFQGADEVRATLLDWIQRQGLQKVAD